MIHTHTERVSLARLLASCCGSLPRGVGIYTQYIQSICIALLRSYSALCTYILYTQPESVQYILAVCSKKNSLFNSLSAEPLCCVCPEKDVIVRREHHGDELQQIRSRERYPVCILPFAKTHRVENGGKYSRESKSSFSRLLLSVCTKHVQLGHQQYTVYCCITIVSHTQQQHRERVRVSVGIYTYTVYTHTHTESSQVLVVYGKSV